MRLHATAAAVWWMIATSMGWSAEFAGLGDLPGGAFHSEARDVSADGSVVVGLASSGQGDGDLDEAFVWALDQGIVGLGSLPHGESEAHSAAFAVSGSGQVVVGIGSSSRGGVTLSDAWQGSPAAGLSPLAITETPNTVSPLGISFSGDVIVGEGYGETETANFENSSGIFVWRQDEGRVSIGKPDWTNGRIADARDVSADGSVIVGRVRREGADPAESYVWSQGEGFAPIAIPYEPIISTRARAVSEDGRIVVGDVEKLVDGRVPYAAFWWSAATGAVEVGGVRSENEASTLHDVSADGTTAVGQAFEYGDPAAFATIWDPLHGPRSLLELLQADAATSDAVAGWQLVRANGVSDDGRTIVGEGINPDGATEAFRVVLDPLTDPVLLPGDANLDGIVDLADFAQVGAWFGRGAFWYQGDFNDDHQVDLADFALLKQNFGAGGSVPEPSSVWIAVACVVGSLAIGGRATASSVVFAAGGERSD